tara:strand:- start:175 stop:552 length:378 start_codon:yes stop_codon:yes gene_type:complete
MTKLNKVVLKNLPNVGVLVVKVDNRVNNTGRPVNKKSARQTRLAKQALYASLNKKFVNGNSFKVKNETYTYSQTGKALGIIKSNVTGYVCNVDYIGRTKVQGFTFVLGKQVKIELNLKTLQFVKA